ncbi:MAG: putative RNA uridine N3 methyltransferase [Candidatus Bathyarchaeia archaeon]
MIEAKRREHRLSIAIPSNLVAEIDSLRDKTSIIGRIGRAASIFRVGEIHIYRNGTDEGNLIRHILNYMDTPQYLRRRLIPRMPELRYVGILPPLRTPHHTVQRSLGKIEKGDHREGVVLKEVGGGEKVHVGLDELLTLVGSPPSPGSRVTVKIISREPLLGEVVGRGKPAVYWGYRVSVHRGLIDLLQEEGFELTIATSRDGEAYRSMEGILREDWRKKGAGGILIAFGSHRRGITEILGLPPKGLFDYNLNMIPEQGTDTVRTEEAVLATLSILNILV